MYVAKGGGGIFDPSFFFPFFSGKTCYLTYLTDEAAAATQARHAQKVGSPHFLSERRKNKS